MKVLTFIALKKAILAILLVTTTNSILRRAKTKDRILFYYGR